jgi:ATP-dependent RNA helicase SUPV3L1/SUV3
VAAEADGPSEAAEPIIAAEPPPPIEVWSPQRRAQNYARSQGTSRQPHSREEAAGEGGRAQTPGDDRGRPPRRERPQQDRAARGQTPGLSEGAGSRKPRQDFAPAAGPRRSAKPERQNGRDDERRNQRGAATSAPPPKRERLPDPDSPFAKLAALKAELEKKGKS